jgi:16S rRNA (uracil1498-N3)-methyltransferase
MSLSHFYLPPTEWHTDLALTGDEARHCTQVQRHRVGDTIAVLDGQGRRAIARIASIARNAVQLAQAEIEHTPAPQTQLILLQAITKGSTFELILEKAVELGATRIIPLLSERSIVRLDASEAARKHEKWQRLIIEASKQCRQPWLPQLALPCSVAQALDQVQPPLLRLVASLAPQARPLRELWATASDTGKAYAGGAAVAIGPEGDFTEAEYHRFTQAAWQPWRLGGLTLRSETAAICALSILAYECPTQSVNNLQR